MGVLTASFYAKIYAELDQCHFSLQRGHCPSKWGALIETPLTSSGFKQAHRKMKKQWYVSVIKLLKMQIMITWFQFFFFLLVCTISNLFIFWMKNDGKKNNYKETMKEFRDYRCKERKMIKLNVIPVLKHWPRCIEQGFVDFAPCSCRHQSWLDCEHFEAKPSLGILQW